MIYVVNYADGEPYESYRKINTKTAYLFGKADKVLEYSSKDIPQSYKDKHKDIFAYKRGAGLWLWKPYIINDALAKINNGDWLFYSDAGALFIKDIHNLISAALRAKTDVMLFEQPLLHRQFTKKETMVNMSVDDIGSNQTLGIMLIQKTDHSTSILAEWLANCEIEQNISPKIFDKNIKEFDDFVSHREDQSILSTLRIKYNLKVFRDPSDYGEMPFQYATNDNFLYAPKKYDNSNYPTILLCSRRTHPYIYYFEYIIKKVLNKFNIRWTEEYFLKRFKCKKIGL